MKRNDAAAPDAYHACYEAALHGRLTANGSAGTALCGFPPHAQSLAAARCAKNGPAFCALLYAEIDQIRRPVFWLDLASEDAASNDKDSVEDTEAQRNYGALPLIVLTAADDTGSPLPPAEMAAIDRVWTAGHARMAGLSSVGVNFVISKSGHFIQMDQPAAVVSAIAEVVSQARDERSSSRRNPQASIPPCAREKTVGH